MKIKNCFMGAATVGLISGIARILQYILTIDDRGFYKDGRFPSFMAGLLVGLLGAGVIWSIVCSLTQKKEQAQFFQKYTTSLPTRVLFLLLAAVSAADGILRWVTAGFSLVPVLCLVGGLSWLTIGASGTFLPLMELFPLMQLSGLIIDFFKNTYKYIQVSEYSLSLLGLCSATYFTLILIKVLCGADCSRRRLVLGSCILLVFGFPSFIAPLAGGFTLKAVLFALYGIVYSLLAALTLIWLPEGKHPVAATVTESPDPNKMDQYINDIPEVQEDEL